MAKTVRLLNVGSIQNSSGNTVVMAHPNHAEGVAHSASKIWFGWIYLVASSIDSNSFTTYKNENTIKYDYSWNRLSFSADNIGNLWGFGGDNYKIRKFNLHAIMINSGTKIWDISNYNVSASHLGHGDVQNCSNGEKAMLCGGALTTTTGAMMNNNTSSFYSFSSNSFSTAPSMTKAGNVGARMLQSTGDHAFRIPNYNQYHTSESMDKASFASTSTATTWARTNSLAFSHPTSNESHLYGVRQGWVGKMNIESMSNGYDLTTQLAREDNDEIQCGVAGDGDKIISGYGLKINNGANIGFKKRNISMVDGSVTQTFSTIGVTGGTGVQNINIATAVL